MATTTTEFDLDYEFPDLDYDLRYLSLAGIDALTAFQNLLPVSSLSLSLSLTHSLNSRSIGAIFATPSNMFYDLWRAKLKIYYRSRLTLP